MAGAADDPDSEFLLSVKCRAQSGAAAELEVLDISAGGCMVRYRNWDALPGERVLTTITGLGVQPSHLVWVEDGRAGIAFEKPLHAAVYDYLRARLEGRLEAERKAAEEEAERERQRQARIRKVI